MAARHFNICFAALLHICIIGAEFWAQNVKKGVAFNISAAGLEGVFFRIDRRAGAFCATFVPPLRRFLRHLTC